MKYVNSLCNNLNTALSNNNLGQTGFEIAVSNHSPFSITIEVMCAAGSLATIAEFIWKIIDTNKKRKAKHQNDDSKNNRDALTNYIPIDVDTHRKYVDARIDQCKEQLLRIKDSYSNKKMNKYIEEITQNLKTDLDDFYESDIMIFKNINHLKE